jgi:hypothetical protein
VRPGTGAPALFFRAPKAIGAGACNVQNKAEKLQKIDSLKLASLFPSMNWGATVLLLPSRLPRSALRKNMTAGAGPFVTTGFSGHHCAILE